MAEQFAQAGADLAATPVGPSPAAMPQPAVGQAPVLDQGRKLPASVIPNTSTVITGIIPAAGTTKTAGSGFTYTHGATGVYVFTFSTAFAAAPVVVVTSSDVSGNAISAYVTAQNAAGFTVTMLSPSNVKTDEPFNFLAYQIA